MFRHYSVDRKYSVNRKKGVHSVALDLGIATTKDESLVSKPIYKSEVTTVKGVRRYFAPDYPCQICPNSKKHLIELKVLSRK